MKGFRTAYWLLGGFVVALALVVGPAGGTTLAPISFDEQVANAERIFRGRVLDISAEKRQTQRGELIFTFVKFEPLEVYKGDVKNPTRLKFLGGQVGDEELRVDAMPKFKVGDEVVLFVREDGNTVCPLLGWSEGAMAVVKDQYGKSKVKLTSKAQAVATAARTMRTLRADDQMDVAEFSLFLRNHVQALKEVR